MHSMGRARKSRTIQGSVAAKSEQPTLRFVPIVLAALEDYVRWRKKRFGLPVKKAAAN
jgi:hypothetical protein